MAEKRIKGVIIPRHDTAFNWAKAVNFVPSEGELIVITPDASNAENVTWETSTGEAYYNNLSDFFCYGDTYALGGDGSSEVHNKVMGVILETENGSISNAQTYQGVKSDDVSTAITVQPSRKVRFKFGDGSLNVNVLPYVTTDVDLTNYITEEELNDILVANGVGEPIDLSGYYKKSETYSRTEVDTAISTAVSNQDKELKDYVDEKVGAGLPDVKDGITPHINEENLHWMIGEEDTGVRAAASGLMRVSSSGIGFVKLENIYEINPNVLIKGVTGFSYVVADHNLVTNKSQNPNTLNIDRAVICYNYRTTNPIKVISLKDIQHFGELIAFRLRIDPIEVNTAIKVALVDDAELINDASAISNEQQLFTFTTTESMGTDYWISIRFDQNGCVNEAICINLDSDTLYCSDTYTVGEDELIDLQLQHPTSIITAVSSDIGAPVAVNAEYDAVYQVDNEFSKNSAMPQSGQAVQQALDELITVIQGSSIEDIPEGITSKFVVLYEE